MSCKYFPQFVMSSDLLIVIIALLIFFFLIHEVEVMDFFFDDFWDFYILRNDLYCNARWVPLLLPPIVKQPEWISEHHAVWLRDQISLKKQINQGSARRERVSSPLSSHYSMERSIRALVAGWTLSGFELQWKGPQPSFIAFLLGQVWKQSCLLWDNQTMGHQHS